jgi:hypothetical protein
MALGVWPQVAAATEVAAQLALEAVLVVLR